MRAIALLLALLLAACSKQEAPLLVTTETPILPADCFPDQLKAPAEPKLSADTPEGASDLAAARDREAWKQAFRAEAANRATCAARLKTLFPAGEKS
jgi:hypothetical protein